MQARQILGSEFSYWPTARTIDAEGVSEYMRSNGSMSLACAVLECEGVYAANNPLRSKGVVVKLNPDWVETTMGIPEGWTDLEIDDVYYHTDFPAPPGPQKEWEPPRLITPKCQWADRIKLCGNGVVPQQAALALRLLLSG